VNKQQAQRRRRIERLFEQDRKRATSDQPAEVTLEEVDAVADTVFGGEPSRVVTDADEDDALEAAFGPVKTDLPHRFGG